MDTVNGVQGQTDDALLVEKVTQRSAESETHPNVGSEDAHEPPEVEHAALPFPEEDRSKNLHELDLDRDQLPVGRALGLLWCVESDTFKFKLALKEQPHTQRGILSMVSSIYDPLGFLAPLTLSAKLLLQDMCRRNYEWDDEIHPILQQQWAKWLRDLERVKAFEVERCLKPMDFGETICGQLHHFSDASESGYGTVTYLKIWNNSSLCHVSFLLGKTRVARLKQVTIPRLELTAAVLAVRVDTMLRGEIQIHLEKSCFWTDSTSVLRYIKNKNKRFHTFVANIISANPKSIGRHTMEVHSYRPEPS